MKKPFFLLVVVAVCAFAPARASVSLQENQSLSDYISATKAEQAETPFFKCIATTIYNSRSVQKIASEVLLSNNSETVFYLHNFLLRNSFEISYCKSYLVHNYPSHHFW